MLARSDTRLYLVLCLVFPLCSGLHQVMPKRAHLKIQEMIFLVYYNLPINHKKYNQFLSDSALVNTIDSWDDFLHVDLFRSGEELILQMLEQNSLVELKTPLSEHIECSCIFKLGSLFKKVLCNALVRVNP